MNRNLESSTTLASPVEVRPGLSWGIKQSFNQYVDATRDGQRGAGAGATEMPDGTFFFELADATEFDPATGLGIIKYQGDVRYKAHGGVLFVMIVDPWLEFGRNGAELSVVNTEHWPQRDNRMVLATLEPSEALLGLPPGWACLQALITPSGVELFNNVYAPGEALDPVRFSFMT